LAETSPPIRDDAHKDTEVYHTPSEGKGGKRDKRGCHEENEWEIEEPGFPYGYLVAPIGPPFLLHAFKQVHPGKQPLGSLVNGGIILTELVLKGGKKGASLLQVLASYNYSCAA